MFRYIRCMFFFAVISDAKLPEYYQGHLTRDSYHDLRSVRNLHNEWGSNAEDQEKDASYWIEKAQQTIKEKLAQRENKKKAQNVLFFLGDGCSMATWFATRLYVAQQNNETNGEDSRLAVEYFPYCGLSKTYCVDAQVADSACSGTAYHTGVKNNIGTLGVPAHVGYKDCKASADPRNHLTSIAREFQLAGKKTGFVTTTRVTHASPAAGYANVADRNWENDAYVLKDNADVTICPDIAWQLVHGETGKNFNVILGGGWQNFLSSNDRDPHGKNGQRAGEENLIKQWIDDKKDNGKSAAYVTNKEELQEVNEVEHLLGIFSTSHMEYHLLAPSTQPTLEDMTLAAIRQLKNENGYFLFIEGGRIDHAHHSNRAHKALDETAEFNKAIEAAVKETDSEDTLIIVTSDHSHSMATNGYPARGNNIFGTAGKGSDKKVYSTLSYNNGKDGFKKGKDGKRYDISKDDMEAINYRFPAYVPIKSSTHAGEDVPIFCKGPWSHLCTGVMEQNTIPFVASYAASVGRGLKLSDHQKERFRGVHILPYP